MNPMLDVLATAAVSIVLAAGFIWLLVTVVRQESQDDADPAPRRSGTKPARRVGKDGYVHG